MNLPSRFTENKLRHQCATISFHICRYNNNHSPAIEQVFSNLLPDLLLLFKNWCFQNKPWNLVSLPRFRTHPNHPFCFLQKSAAKRISRLQNPRKLKKKQSHDHRFSISYCLVSRVQVYKTDTSRLKSSTPRSAKRDFYKDLDSSFLKTDFLDSKDLESDISVCASRNSHY